MSAGRAVDILIVDDDVDVVESLEDVLADVGYATATARDGLEALAYLAGAPPPGVILLDAMMPNMDGAAFRERQLADARLAGIPVVLLTADARFEAKMRAIGATAVVTKPVELGALLAVLQRFGLPVRR